MGWKPKEFWEASMGEFIHSRKGYNTAQERKWEHTRLIVSSIINTVSKKKVSPKDIVELSFDKEFEEARKAWIEDHKPTDEQKAWMKRKGLL